MEIAWLRRVGLVAAALLLVACAEAPLSERAFAEDAIERMAAQQPEMTFTISPDDPLQIDAEGHPEFNELTINLHRVFAYCETASAQDCETELAQFVSAISLERSPPTAANLRVIVRDAEYWTHVLGTFPESDGIPMHRRIGEDLYAILAFDSPQQIALALPEDIADLDIEPDAAWAKAVAQTQATIPPVPVAEAGRLSEGLAAFEGEEYVGGMMLDIDGWAKVAATAGPDMVVTVTSDRFVVAGIVPSGPELERLRVLAGEDCTAAPRCISPNVYRLREGRWVIAD